MLTINQLFFTLILYGVGVLIVGVALYPSFLFVAQVWTESRHVVISFRLLILSIAVAAAYFIFGVCLMLFVGVFRTVFKIRLREGEHSIGSPAMVEWMFYNALFLLVNTVFMDFMLLTPLVSFFYRLMGAQVGSNVQINSKNVADHPLLTIGDRSVIGGNATVICHSFERAGLKLKRVIIGKSVVVGLNAVILPGVEIGDGAVVAAGAIVPKGTKIEPGTVYYGARKDFVDASKNPGNGGNSSDSHRNLN